MPSAALSKTNSQTGQSPSLASASPASWFAVAGIHALVDSDRYLGCMLEEDGRWLAFDAMHINPTRTGFSFLGYFNTMNEARHAVARSVGVSSGAQSR
ncbi:MAG: hypothetical protein ABJC09_12620 [Terriglobia bacterium]